MFPGGLCPWGVLGRSLGVLGRSLGGPWANQVRPWGSLSLSPTTLSCIPWKLYLKVADVAIIFSFVFCLIATSNRRRWKEAAGHSTFLQNAQYLVDVADIWEFLISRIKRKFDGLLMHACPMHLGARMATPQDPILGRYAPRALLRPLQGPILCPTLEPYAPREPCSALSKGPTCLGALVALLQGSILGPYASRGPNVNFSIFSLQCPMFNVHFCVLRRMAFSMYIHISRFIVSFCEQKRRNPPGQNYRTSFVF